MLHALCSSRRACSDGLKYTGSVLGPPPASPPNEGRPGAQGCREALVVELVILPPPPAEPVLLAEVLGLRTILINLFFRLANAEQVTPTEMEQVIERADADKFKKARARLKDAKTALRGGGCNE